MYQDTNTDSFHKYPNMDIDMDTFPATFLAPQWSCCGADGITDLRGWGDSFQNLTS